MVHVINHGVPCRTEAALCAVGVIVYDVYGGYSSLLVEWHVVVGYHSAVGSGEGAAVTCLACGAPYLLHDGGSILFAHTFLVESGAMSAHHVEQYAVAHVVTLRQIVGEVLCAEGP